MEYNLHEKRKMQWKLTLSICNILNVTDNDKN